MKSRQETLDALEEHRATVANHKRGRSNIQLRQAINQYLDGQQLDMSMYRLGNGELERMRHEFIEQTGFEVSKSTFSTYTAKARQTLRTLAEEKHKRDILEASNLLQSGESIELKPPNIWGVSGLTKIIKA
jgi:geranylgeranyl pyrophosphate synthase